MVGSVGFGVVAWSSLKAELYSVLGLVVLVLVLVVLLVVVLVLLLVVLLVVVLVVVVVVVLRVALVVFATNTSSVAWLERLVSSVLINSVEVGIFFSGLLKH